MANQSPLKVLQGRECFRIEVFKVFVSGALPDLFGKRKILSFVDFRLELVANRAKGSLDELDGGFGMLVGNQEILQRLVHIGLVVKKGVVRDKLRLEVPDALFHLSVHF